MLKWGRETEDSESFTHLTKVLGGDRVSTSELRARVGFTKWLGNLCTSEKRMVNGPLEDVAVGNQALIGSITTCESSRCSCNY